jgi:hypothetical protein
MDSWRSFHRRPRSCIPGIESSINRFTLLVRSCFNVCVCVYALIAIQQTNRRCTNVPELMLSICLQKTAFWQLTLRSLSASRREWVGDLHFLFTSLHVVRLLKCDKMQSNTAWPCREEKKKKILQACCGRKRGQWWWCDGAGAGA